jgi:hypothetical protein
LMLDKSKGLVRGDEVIVNGTFDGTTGWVGGSGGILSASNNVLTITNPVGDGTAAGYQTISSALTAGRLYEVTATVVGYTGVGYRLGVGASVSGLVDKLYLSGSDGIPLNPPGAGTYTGWFTYDGTTPLFFTAVNFGSNGDSISIRDVSIKEVPGNHFYQTDEAKRPRLRKSGSLWYLEFDGSDDLMAATFASPIEQPNSVAIAFDPGPSVSYRTWLGAIASTGTNRTMLFNAGTGTDERWFAGENLDIYELAANTETVLVGEFDGANSWCKQDGAAAQTGNAGANNADGMVLGALYSTGTYLTAIKVYGLLRLSRAFSESEIAAVEEWAADLSGVTLGAAAKGGTVTEEDGWRIHTFDESGTLTVLREIEVEYLVVGGGGGGGSRTAGAGGGGAGGYRSSVDGEASGGGSAAEEMLTLTPGTYNVVVGGGGTGGDASAAARGTNGTASSLSTIESAGGGGGGARAAEAIADGANGGCGGGAGAVTSGTLQRSGGAGTANQGYAGGQNFAASTITGGGGGGGAGAVGADATSTSAAGDGGSGVQSAITGEAVTRASGGAGSDSTDSGEGTSGIDGKGDGGNAGAGTAAGGKGGDGTVILRYRV